MKIRKAERLEKALNRIATGSPAEGPFTGKADELEEVFTNKRTTEKEKMVRLTELIDELLQGFTPERARGVVTPAEYAKEKGISYHTVLNWLRDKQLKNVVKIGSGTATRYLILTN
jgi:DNA invertase Pin-like site-specific DNA recombinase